MNDNTKARLRVWLDGIFLTDHQCKTSYVGGRVWMEMSFTKLSLGYLNDVLRKKLKCDDKHSFWYIREGLSVFAGKQKIRYDRDVEDLLRTRDDKGMVTLYVVKEMTQEEREEFYDTLFQSTKPTTPRKTKLAVKSIAKKHLLTQPKPLQLIHPKPHNTLPPQFTQPHITPEKDLKTAPKTRPTEAAHSTSHQNASKKAPKTVNLKKAASPRITNQSQKTPKTVSNKSPKVASYKTPNKPPSKPSHIDEDPNYEPNELSDDELDDLQEEVAEDELFAETVDPNILGSVEADLGGLFDDINVEEWEGYDDTVEVRDDVVLSDEDELESEADSDAECVRYPSFNPATGFKGSVTLTKGLKFPNYKVFKKALRFHCIQEGYDYYYLHNCVKRVTVYCKQRCACVWDKKRGKFGKCICGSKNKCGFRVHGRLLESQNTFQIKSLQLKHKDNCLLADKNTKVTAEYLAEKYIDEFRLDPYYKVNTLIGKVMIDSGVEVRYHKAYLAKKKAYEMIYGMDTEQYKRVWDYADTVKKHNPGSSMFISLGGIDRPPPFFQRMYMCLDACKVGFVSGCRPILGLDGCHLNGLYPGILLVAVGKDSNCNIFPLAWAVVEVENKETWTWFLQHLVQDIESVAHEGSYIKSKDELAFISDRQKGLMEAFNIVTPNAEVRFCARHIWANFSKTYNGVEYKQMFWKAARAYTKHEFDMTMESIKGMSIGAFAYLNAIPPKHWSRHAFSTQTKSEILLNNCCESFNNVLKQCRDKPILTLMEWIRRYVMNRIFTRFQILEKYKGTIMNTATKSLSKAGKESRNYEIIQPGLMEFEVISKCDLNERWVVNLDKMTCECFKWELTGIPCAHAYGCLVRKRIDPPTFVHKAYSRELYNLAYSTHVHPLPGPNNWEKTTHVQPTPPPFRKMPGRPSAKKRKRDPNEKVIARTAKKKPAKCNNCGIEGHYMKSCKNPGVAKRPKKTTIGKGSKTNQGVVAFQEISCTSSQPQPSQS